MASVAGQRTRFWMPDGQATLVRLSIQSEAKLEPLGTPAQGREEHLMPTAEGYRFAGSTGWGWGPVLHTNRGHQHGRRRPLEVAGDEIVDEGQPGRTQAQGECGEGKRGAGGKRAVVAP